MRTLLKRVRQAMGSRPAPPFRIDDGSVALDLSVVDCDLVDVLKRLKRASASDVVETLSLLRDDLLDGFEGACEQSQEWLERQRDGLRQAFAKAATNVIDRGDLDAQPKIREALALRILHNAPIDPTAHRALLKLQGLRGGSKASRSVRDFAEILEKPGFDDFPAPAREAAVSLGGEGEENTAIATPKPDEASASPRVVNSVAAEMPELVVYAAPGFEEDAARGVRAAFTEDLLAQLWKAGLPRVVCVSGEARGAAIAPANSSNRYNLNLLFRGPEPVRASLRLSTVAGSDILWADTVDLIAERHDNVVARVGDLIQRKIDEHQIATSEGRTDQERSKYILVAMAEREAARTDPAALRRARRLLAIAMQDGWRSPRALAALSRSYRMEWFLTLGRDPTLLPNAQRAARALLDLAPESALAYRELAGTSQFMGDHDTALEHIARAREIAPYDSRVSGEYASVLIHDGQTQAGVEFIKAGPAGRGAMDGFFHWATAIGHLLRGEYRASISEISRMPEPATAFRLQMANLAMLGEKDQTAELRARFLKENPNFLTNDWLPKSPLRLYKDRNHIREALRVAGL